jgi:hypothetical protein
MVKFYITVQQYHCSGRQHMKCSSTTELVQLVKAT